MIDGKKPYASRIFRYSVIDNREELDEKYESCYQSLSFCLQGKGEREVSESLAREVAKSHDNVCYGLMVGMLVDPDQAKTFFTYLNYSTNDGFKCLVAELNKLLLEKYHKLLEPVQDQMLWLTREMAKSGLPGADSVCWNMLRNGSCVE